MTHHGDRNRQTQGGYLIERERARRAQETINPTFIPHKKNPACPRRSNRATTY